MLQMLTNVMPTLIWNSRLQLIDCDNFVFIENTHHRPKMTDSGERANDSAVGDMGAGLTRAISAQFRRVFAVFGRADIGSLPRVHKVPFGQIADRFSVAFDAVQSVRSVQSTHSVDETQGQRLRSAAKHRASVVLHATPTFLRSAILGTVLFGVYEETLSAAPFANRELLFHGIRSKHSTSSLPVTVAETTTTTATCVLRDATVAGAVAGSIHAFGSIIWDQIAWKVSSLSPKMSFLSSQPPNPFWIGTTIHHTASHATLFAVYEVCKRWGMAGDSQDMTAVTMVSARDVGVVMAAGCVSSAAQELVSLPLRHLESNGLQEGLQMLRTIPWSVLIPPGTVRQIVMGMPGVGLGFVAFEFGKQVLTS
jgi:hypothetical protein